MKSLEGFKSYTDRKKQGISTELSFSGYTPHTKQRQFHAAGNKAKERLFLAGNRTGKTYCGIIESCMHLTGIYPDWWEGKRFTRPIKAWAASVTTSLTKEVLETGYLDVIPVNLILGSNVQQSTFRIKHSSGGESILSFKSYEQGRKKFQAAKLDLVHLDEEPSSAIYTEALMRTMSTDVYNKGILILTMTPLMGLTDLVNQYIDGKDGDVVDDVSKKYYTMASWSDNPYLLEEEKKDLLESLPPHEREAREKGIPSMGRGMVYPIAEETFVVNPFLIPEYWSKVYAIDFGWTAPTAVMFGAYDRDNDIVYLYAEYYQAERTPQQHAVNLCNMGASTMHGVYDPAGEQKSQKDGGDIVSLYRQSGLHHMSKANNAKEEGVMKVLQRFQNSKIKVFSTMTQTLREFRMHARDEKGDIKKGNDHLMDCMRYLVMSGLYAASAEYQDLLQSSYRKVNYSANSWMGN